MKCNRVISEAYKISSSNRGNMGKYERRRLSAMFKNIRQTVCPHDAGVEHLPCPAVQVPGGSKAKEMVYKLFKNKIGNNMCQRKGVLLLRRYEFGMTMRERTRMSLEERPCVEAEGHSVAKCLDQYVVRQASPTTTFPISFIFLRSM